MCGNASEGRLAGEVGEERNMKGGWREGKVLPMEGATRQRPKGELIPPGAVVGGLQVSLPC